MYLEHYGLREAPFRITPHTDFFFAGGNRGATLEALVYAITHDEGIVKVTGEVGSGKTMLCRMLLERLPEQVETVYLANPSYSREEILLALAAELKLDLTEGRPPLLLRALQDKLLELYAAGRQVVVLIDEAHAMPRETLEEIRLLSNLESSRHKLLQIVLFGQPELDQRLAQADLRQLKERVTHNFLLEPLRRTDIAPYLMFRLRAAGYHGPDVFSSRAIQRITRASEGLTRRINILADKSLLAAFAESSHLVDTPQVNAAIRDAQFSPMGKHSLKRWHLGVLAAALTGGLIALAVTLPRPIASAPAVLTPPPPLTPPAPLTATEPQPQTVIPTPAPSNAPLPAAIGKLTQERLAATQTWLSQADSRHYVLQLLVMDGATPRQVESYLAQAAQDLAPDQLGVYRSRLADRERWGIIYGDYPDRESANSALRNLPPRIGAGGAYLRRVSQLR